MDHEPRRRGNIMAKNAYWDEKPLEALTRRNGRACATAAGAAASSSSRTRTPAASISPRSPAACSTSRPAAAPTMPPPAQVRDCLKLTPDLSASLAWLPPTCAYRLRAEGKRLAWWHPLVSGSPETVHEAGISVRGRVSLTETDLKIDDYAAHIVSWPGRSPRGARARPPESTAAKSARGKAPGRSHILRIPIVLYSLKYSLRRPLAQKPGGGTREAFCARV